MATNMDDMHKRKALIHGNEWGEQTVYKEALRNADGSVRAGTRPASIYTAFHDLNACQTMIDLSKEITEIETQGSHVDLKDAVTRHNAGGPNFEIHLLEDRIQNIGRVHVSPPHALGSMIPMVDIEVDVPDIWAKFSRGYNKRSGLDISKDNLENGDPLGQWAEGEKFLTLEEAQNFEAVLKSQTPAIRNNLMRHVTASLIAYEDRRYASFSEKLEARIGRIQQLLADAQAREAVAKFSDVNVALTADKILPNRAELETELTKLQALLKVSQAFRAALKTTTLNRVPNPDSDLNAYGAKAGEVLKRGRAEIELQNKIDQRARLEKAYKAAHEIRAGVVLVPKDEIQIINNGINRDALQTLVDVSEKSKPGALSTQVAVALAAEYDANKQDNRADTRSIREELAMALSGGTSAGIVNNLGGHDGHGGRIAAANTAITAAQRSLTTVQDRLDDAQKADETLAATTGKNYYQHMIVQQAKAAADSIPATAKPDVVVKLMTDAASKRAGELAGRNPEVAQIINQNMKLIAHFATTRDQTVAWMTALTNVIGIQCGAQQRMEIAKKEEFIAGRALAAAAATFAAQPTAPTDNTVQNMQAMLDAAIAAATETARELGDPTLADPIVRAIRAIGTPMPAARFQVSHAIADIIHARTQAVKDISVAEQAAIVNYIIYCAQQAAIKAAAETGSNINTVKKAAETVAGHAAQILGDDDAAKDDAIKLAINLINPAVMAQQAQAVALAVPADPADTVVKRMTDEASASVKQVQALFNPAVGKIITDNMQVIANNANGRDQARDWIAALTKVIEMQYGVPPASAEAIEAAQKKYMTYCAKQVAANQASSGKAINEISSNVVKIVKAIGQSFGKNVTDAEAKKLINGSYVIAHRAERTAQVAFEKANSNVKQITDAVIARATAIETEFGGGHTKFVTDNMTLVANIATTPEQARDWIAKFSALMKVEFDIPPASPDAIAAARKQYVTYCANQAADSVIVEVGEEAEFATTPAQAAIEITEKVVLFFEGAASPLPPHVDKTAEMRKRIDVPYLIAQQMQAAALATYSPDDSNPMIQAATQRGNELAALFGGDMQQSLDFMKGNIKLIAINATSEEQVKAWMAALAKLIEVELRIPSASAEVKKAARNVYVAYCMNQIIAINAALQNEDNPVAAADIKSEAVIAVQNLSQYFGVTDTQTAIANINNPQNKAALADPIAQHLRDQEAALAALNVVTPPVVTPPLSAEEITLAEAVIAAPAADLTVIPNHGEVKPYNAQMIGIEVNSIQKEIEGLEEKKSVLEAGHAAAQAAANKNGATAETVRKAVQDATSAILDGPANEARDAIKDLQKEAGEQLNARQQNQAAAVLRTPFHQHQAAFFKQMEKEKLREERLAEAKKTGLLSKDAKTIPANFKSSAFTDKTADKIRVPLVYDATLDVPTPEAIKVKAPLMVEQKLEVSKRGLQSRTLDLRGLTTDPVTGLERSTQDMEKIHKELIKYLNEQKLTVSGKDLLIVDQSAKAADGSMKLSLGVSMKGSVHGAHNLGTHAQAGMEKVATNIENFMIKKGYLIVKEEKNAVARGAEIATGNKNIKAYSTGNENTGPTVLVKPTKH